MPAIPRRWSRWEEIAIGKSPLIAVVDDDESVRESLPEALHQLGFDVEAFSSAEQFLASGLAVQAHCLVLDIAMPGMSGPDLQRELGRQRREIPIVFITGHCDDATRRRVMEGGAIECIVKPFDEAELFDAVSRALCVRGGRPAAPAR